MNRSQRRSEQRLAEAHNKVLADLLGKFFNFLNRKPQPSTEEVRSEFQKSEMTWKMYCMQHHLGIKTSLLFNARVSYEWEQKYVKK